MKKIFTLFFVFFAFESIAVEKKTTFNFDVFKEAQNSGKTVVVSSWNKYCGTCTQQTKILDQAKKKFPNIIFFKPVSSKHNIVFPIGGVLLINFLKASFKF